jgi:hypothetical protein
MLVIRARAYFEANFRGVVELKQNPVNFAVCLSIINRIQSIFVKYAQLRLNQSASEMCA